MGKGKPRHNPNKKANTYGDFCQYGCDVFYDNNGNITGMTCEWGGDKVIEKCHGNRHNCCKVTYKQEAIHRSTPWTK